MRLIHCFRALCGAKKLHVALSGSYTKLIGNFQAHWLTQTWLVKMCLYIFTVFHSSYGQRIDLLPLLFGKLLTVPTI